MASAAHMRVSLALMALDLTAAFAGLHSLMHTCRQACMHTPSPATTHAPVLELQANVTLVPVPSPPGTRVAALSKPARHHWPRRQC